MTRARRSIHVLTCFQPEDLDHTRLSHGAVELYELLNREIAGKTDLGTPASRAAASEQALGADPLVADLGDRLRARGARVWHQYDGVIVVVAAADPLSTMGQDDADIPWPVAIESDGTEQYRTMSVRERSRLRPQLLERMGWRYMPLWTIEVFTDPSTCADRIAGYLGLENVLPPGRGTASGGFFDEDLDSRPVVTAGDDRNDDQAPRLEREAVVTPQDHGQDNTEDGGQPDTNGDGQAAPVDPKAGTGGILPNKAAEDDPRNWGDGAEDDHDSWLKENKPPHWG
jgi:hypothetical protein